MTFNICKAIRPSDGRAVKGMGGRNISKGSATIQIPLNNLAIIIEVKFMILQEDNTPLLSMRDMVTHILDISLLNSTL